MEYRVMRYRVMQRVQSDAVCRAFRRGPVATSSKAVESSKYPLYDMYLYVFLYIHAHTSLVD
jgi:hypothetical protein